MREPWLGLKHGVKRRGKEVVLGRAFCPQCGRWRQVNDFGIKPNGRLRSWCETCQRISNRRAHLRQTEKQRDERREYQRIWHEVRRRRQGVPERRWITRRSKVDTAERIMLPPEPVLWAIRTSGVSHEELSRRSGVPQRTLTRLFNGESKHVRIDVADKLAVALDLPLTLIDPEWLEAA